MVRVAFKVQRQARFDEFCHPYQRIHQVSKKPMEVIAPVDEATRLKTVPGLTLLLRNEIGWTVDTLPRS